MGDEEAKPLLDYLPSKLPSKLWWSRWWPRWLSPSAALVGVPTAAIAHANEVVWLTIFASLLVAVTPLAVQAFRERMERRADAADFEERVAWRLAIADILDPLVSELAKLIGRREPAISSQIASAVVAAAAAHFGPDRTRASFFALHATSAEDDVLTCQLWRGRAGEPRTEFRHGTASGDFVMSLMRERKTFICHDVRVDPPPGWADHGQVYRTFISAPVLAGEGGYGLLSVDALDPGDLDETDAALLGVLAGLIGIAIELNRQNNPPPQTPSAILPRASGGGHGSSSVKPEE